MSRILKIFGKLVHAFIVLVGILSLFLFAFKALWDSGKELTYSEALDLLKIHGTTEHRLILDECAVLLNEGKDLLFSGENIPESLKSLSPYYVRVGHRNCEVNFYKVPGKGLGYFVRKDKEGKLAIYWHNYFESWESYKIEFGRNES